MTLFEKSNRIGGNAWTYVTRNGEEVDIAVAAFGRAGCKHLFELFSRLKVETRPYRTYVSLHNLGHQDRLILDAEYQGSLGPTVQVVQTEIRERDLTAFADRHGFWGARLLLTDFTKKAMIHQRHFCHKEVDHGRRIGSGFVSRACYHLPAD